VQIVRQHFWLLLAIQEAKLSLKRFRQMLFGEPTKGRAASVSSAPSTEAEKSERNAALARPIVMSDALAANAADECRLIRCHCLAHGQRKFRLLAEVFPDECARVMAVLKRCSSTTSRRKRHS
jgi:hypothetical protein